MTAPDGEQQRPEGSTIVLCTASGCCTPLHMPLLVALRDTVRVSVHGVLVTSGCVLGAVACRTRRPGPLLLVQPCDTDRQPVGCAVLVGPLKGDADVAVVGAWLRDGRFDPLLLPARLRDAQRGLSAAARN